MSGVAIIRSLLANWAPLTTLVPAARIHAGQVPQGETMPAVSVREIGVREIATVSRGLPVKTSRARVQVTVLAKDPGGYVQMKNILKAAALGPGVHTGTVLGYRVGSVEQDGINPEIPAGDDLIFEQSRDFVVTFTEPN